MGDDSSRNLLNPYSSTDDFVDRHIFVEQVDDFDPFSELISGEIDYPSLNCGFVGDKNGEDEDEGDDEDDDDDGYHSSSATKTKKTSKVIDRSKTLISERKRRGRMKEKLYALRSLVPNITKMDKASIVGDAVLYVQDLQIQAKKLKAEIAGLEASLSGAKRHQKVAAEEEEQPPENNGPNKRTQYFTNPKHISRKILQMDVFQVEEGGFYTRLVCCRGVGVAVSLYKALETLTTFNILSSNLASASPERFVLTFNLTVPIKEGDEAMMNLASVKLWITGALLTQGFEFGNISS